VGLRQWTTNILIAPESSGACGLAYNDGHIVIGDACLGNRVLVHELSHQVDAHALAQYHSGYVRYTDSPRYVHLQIYLCRWILCRRSWDRGVVRVVQSY